MIKSLCLVLSFLLTFVLAFAGQPAGVSENGYRLGIVVWKDSAGNPLPFQDATSVENFLREAKIVSTETIPEGTTKPRKVLLRLNGVEAYGCFRHVSVFKSLERFKSGAVKVNFRDDAVFEAAAYRLAQLLGFPNVPPTVRRRIQRKMGTLQLWIPGCISEKTRLKKEIRPPNGWRWAMEFQMVQLFDTLIVNEDRNQGNLLVDPDWRIWMVDHTRSFRNYSDPKEIESLRICDREVWNRLEEVPDPVIQKALEPFLSGAQIRTLLKRRASLVMHLRELIGRRGEGKVLVSIWQGPDASASLRGEDAVGVANQARLF